MFFKRKYDDMDFVQHERMLEKKNSHTWDYNSKDNFNQYNNVKFQQPDLSQQKTTYNEEEFKKYQNQYNENIHKNCAYDNTPKYTSKAVDILSLVLKIPAFMIIYSAILFILEIIMGLNSGIFGFAIFITLAYKMFFKKRK